MIDQSAIQRLSGKSDAILPAGDGTFTLRIDGKYVHSKYSPHKESLRLIADVTKLEPKTTLVIVLGCGLGYHIEELERKGYEHIILIERDPRVFDIFRQIYDLSKLPYVISPESPVDMIDSIFSTLNIHRFRRIKTVVLRGHYDPEMYAEIESRIERLVKVKLGDFATRLKFEENWFINIIRNIPHLYSSITVHGLRRKGIQYPVLIISAGPSLKNSLDAIKLLEKKAVTVAVDTAVLPLYEAGIVPDFIYSLDSQVHNLKDFTMMESDYLNRSTLIYDLVVNSALPHTINGLKIVSNTAHWDVDYAGTPFQVKSELVKWIETAGGFNFGDVETGGSVATSAFHLAYLIGATDIALIGQDLAYSYGVSHSPSTPHFYRIRNMSHRLNPMESIFRNVMLNRRTLEVDAVSGRVTTDFVLNNFRGWFEETCKNLTRQNRTKRDSEPIGIYNLTGQGARIAYCDEVQPQELLRKWDNLSKPDKSDLLQGIKLIDSYKVDKILSHLNGLNGFVDSLTSDSSILTKISSGDYPFLNRYFMREEMLFDRYEKWDETMTERKMMRLKKNINGVLNAFR